MPEPTSDKLPHQLFGDGAAPANTRERILEHAQDLFYSQGFHAVGVDQIASSASVTKATLYNHFESRDQLTVEVIKRADSLLQKRFMEEVRSRSGWDPRRALLAMFDVLDDWFRQPEFLGCLFLKACMAFPNKNDPIHKAASSHYFVTTKEIAEIASSLEIEDAKGFAEQWVLLIEGALVYRTVAQDNNAASIAKRSAIAALERASSQA